jgi:hydroxyacylglutathione hydrolase
MTFKLTPLPAFADNYIWWLDDGRNALVVDPGDATPVLAALEQRPELTLSHILVTHHHADHTGGVAELRQKTGAAVLGPAAELIPQPFTPLSQGHHIQALGLNFEVLDVPGHTAGHIAFYCASIGQSPLLFCGDTLFSAGCGRLFEGTPAQMLESLERLAQLPGNTAVCCTHEYTLSNLRFARTVEPGNLALAAYAERCELLRAQAQPTLPSNMAQELAINPFLRSREKGVLATLASRDPQLNVNDPVAAFACLRQWKNEFK